MNLRQKIKKAKRELKELENANYDRNSTWEIISKTKKQIHLQNIIKYKRKFNTYYSEDEKYKIDWKKLTYISIHADFTEFGVLKSSNGKPLKMNGVKAFINDMIKTKVYKHAKKIASEEVENGDFVYRTDYFISVSNDKTKNKRLHREMIAYQFKGEDKIYHYENKSNGGV